MEAKSKRAIKNLRLLYEESQSENEKSLKLPLREIEENSLPLGEKGCKVTGHKYSPDKIFNQRKKKKKKSEAIALSPLGEKISYDTLKLNGVDNVSSKLQHIIYPALDEIVGSNKIPMSFTKLVSSQEELKISINKIRQAFSGYKLSSFFCFNSEFIKEYGEKLSKAEQCVENMSAILGKAIMQEIIKSSGSVDLSDIEVLSKDTGETNSLTPPSSEIGMNSSKNKDESPNPPKKRRISNNKNNNSSNSKKDEVKELKEVEKKPVRKVRIRVRPLANKIIVDSNELVEKGKVPSTNDPTTNSVTDVQEEYEVRKIQDYVKKQGSYYYRVSWRGYDSDEDTFEPADHLDGCDEVLTDFFYERLKKRKNVINADQLRLLSLPSDEKVKEMLYSAFERLVYPISEETRKNGIKLVTSLKGPFKSKSEIQEEIIKFSALRDPSLERYKKSYTSIIEQISYWEIHQERLKQLADLRAWERSMNIISSDSAPLTVENNVDLALPPLDFVYINEYIPGPDIIIPNDPVAGCECKECNSIQKSCCANQMGSFFAYNKNGRLRISLGTPIYECNKACECPVDCINRVVQNGRKVSLAIFRTSNDRGWGVKALELIKKDQFVSEYVGEVISSDEAEQRGMKYDSKGCTYLFDLDYNKGDLNPYTVDAAKYGNVSHFINHSCDPNLVVFNVWVNCLDPDLPKLALFAVRDIKKGEEITFDYNSGSTRQIYITDKIDGGNSLSLTPIKRENEDGADIIPTTELIRKTPRNRGLNGGKTQCRCGAANCRKYFF